MRPRPTAAINRWWSPRPLISSTRQRHRPATDATVAGLATTRILDGMRLFHDASPCVMSAAVWRSACKALSTPGLAPLACQTMPKAPGSEVNVSGSRATSPRAASLCARPRDTTDNMLEPASRLRLVAIAELSMHAGGGTKPAAMKVSSMQRRSAVPAGGSRQGWAEASRQLGAPSLAGGTRPRTTARPSRQLVPGREKNGSLENFLIEACLCSTEYSCSVSVK